MQLMKRGQDGSIRVCGEPTLCYGCVPLRALSFVNLLTDHRRSSTQGHPARSRSGTFSDTMVRISSTNRCATEGLEECDLERGQ
jgi:hypothetical protein